MSPNRQKPLAGAARNAVFNTFRRTSYQIGYWLPPLALAYYAMHWATEWYGMRMPDAELCIGRGQKTHLDEFPGIQDIF